jgi:hypothetical protein
MDIDGDDEQISRTLAIGVRNRSGTHRKLSWQRTHSKDKFLVLTRLDHISSEINSNVYTSLIQVFIDAGTDRRFTERYWNLCGCEPAG